MLTLHQRVGWLRHLGIACFQQHHRELEPVFRPYVGAEAVVVDVGAHAGQFTKLFAGMAPQGRVYAFEPSVYARSILKPAVAFNRLRNVEIVPTGLSDQPGQATLSTPVKERGGFGFGLASLAGVSGGRVRSDQTVELQTLDGFAQRADLKRLDFLKADVEGWEAHVLRGGAQTLRRFRPALFLELSVEALGRAGETAPPIWDLLGPMGYSALKAPEFRSVAAFDGTSDYLFVAR
ncbi:MAG: FkbM family methyltransferase [Phenylobacterium sp.]|nr:MAG: FkbM family methyltransferase [Phenylobacterium sp.]